MSSIHYDIITTLCGDYDTYSLHERIIVHVIITCTGNRHNEMTKHNRHNRHNKLNIVQHNKLNTVMWSVQGYNISVITHFRFSVQVSVWTHTYRMNI